VRVIDSIGEAARGAGATYQEISSRNSNPHGSCWSSSSSLALKRITHGINTVHRRSKRLDGIAYLVSAGGEVHEMIASAL
jgi:hypothetical protein